MKLKITGLILIFLSFNAFADCEIKKVNPSSKYEFINTTLDALFIDDKDRTESQNISKDKSLGIVDNLAILKKSVLHNQCSLEALNNFNFTNKEKIKSSLNHVKKYLIARNQFNQELIDILNGKELGDAVSMNNHFADLKVYRDEELLKKEEDADSAISIAAQFEQNDDLSVDFSAIKKEERYYTLGITDAERRLLINKIAEQAKYDQLHVTTLLVALSLFVQEISFENKKTISLDTIKKYAKPAKAKI